MKSKLLSPHAMTNRQGYILLMSVLILFALLLAGTYLLLVANSERKISDAQIVATKNYYIAEMGIQDVIWKIRNISDHRDDFLAGILNLDVSQSNIFNDPNASYSVHAESTAVSEAQLIATSTYMLSQGASQRVVKVYISQATGDGSDWDFASFAGGRGGQQNGNFRFDGSGVIMTVTSGRIHANQLIDVKKGELIVNDGSVTSGNVINTTAGGSITLNNSYQDAPTTTIDMLQIDFDSDEPTSWKNRATATYTPNAFAALPGGTVLDGIIYVTGDARIIDKQFRINGVLVAEGDIEMYFNNDVFRTSVHATFGGGLLAKDDLEITSNNSDLVIRSLMYAADDLKITSNSDAQFLIEGAMAGFDASVKATGGTIILNYTPANYQTVIDPIYNVTSPIIQVDHWEEQY